MYTASAKLTFHIQHANSLKEKRQVVRSVTDKARHKFNASIAEVDTQNLHRVMTIGIALVSGDASHAQKSLEEIIRYMEEHANADLIQVEEGCD